MKIGNLSEVASKRKISPKMPNNKKNKRNKQTAGKVCDVPYCVRKETPTMMFDDTNITCMKCDHFICSCCVEKNWKGTWTQEDFYKPKYELPGLKHELWNCPFCRATFDRFRPDGSGLEPELKTMTIGEFLGSL